MRVAFIADVHLANHKRMGGLVIAGVNRRCRLVLDALCAACDRARELGCAALVVLGDLFDHARPEPQVIRAAQDAFARFGGRVFAMVGNHDLVSTAPGDHAMGPLASELVTVVDGSKAQKFVVGDVLLVLVPFVPGKSSETIAAAIQGVDTRMAARAHTILGIHAGIRFLEKTVAGRRWEREAQDAIDLEEAFRFGNAIGARHVFAGNWHDRACWSSQSGTVVKSMGPGRLTSEDTVLQVGALAPTGFDNPGLYGYGTLAWYDSEEDVVNWEDVAAGPRFLVKRPPQDRLQQDLPKPILPDVEAARAAGCAPFVRIEAADRLEFEAARGWLQVAREEGLVEDGEVLPPEDPGAAQELAADLSAANRRDGLRVQLTDYLSAQPDLATDVPKRDALFYECWGFLDEALRGGGFE